MEGSPSFIGHAKDERRRPFLVVSYYTLKSGYEKEVLNLTASLERWGIDYKIEGIESLGSWFKNIAWRPAFLNWAQEENPGRSLVWLDADARIQRDPVLFDKLEATNYDLAVHYRDGRELLGGTMWISGGPGGRRLVDLWVAFQDQNSGLREQQSLQFMLPRHKEIRVFNLPANYTQIFDLMRAAGQPVIEHFQASRRFKASMGGIPARPEAKALERRIHR